MLRVRIFNCLWKIEERRVCVRVRALCLCTCISMIKERGNMALAIYC